MGQAEENQGNKQAKDKEGLRSYTRRERLSHQPQDVREFRARIRGQNDFVPVKDGVDGTRTAKGRAANPTWRRLPPQEPPPEPKAYPRETWFNRILPVRQRLAYNTRRRWQRVKRWFGDFLSYFREEINRPR